MKSPSPSRHHHTDPASAIPEVRCDVLVIGSGAGGLSAAVTAAHAGARVEVVEAAPVLGGASAWSGGWMWTPGSFFAKADGVDEGAEKFRTYLRTCLGDDYDAERIDAFLDGAPRMVDFFHHQTFMRFVPGTTINDIYGDLPGAGTGHRSVGPKPVNARRIPRPLRRKLRRQLYETSFLGLGIMAGSDLQRFLSASRGDLRGLLHATWRVGLHVIDLVVHRTGMQLVNGTALTARLAKSADDRGVGLRVSAAAEELLTDEDGRVVGARVRTPQGVTRYLASRGVILATGGFPNDVERRRRLFPRTPTGREHHTLAPETADGSGITMAEQVGAHFRTDVASPAAWCPVSLVPYRNGRVGTFPHIMDRAKPGAIGVLSTGRRFVNEANGYYDYVAGMIAAAPEGEPVQSWLIADSRYVRRYPLGMVKPRPVPLFPYLRSGYLKKGRTLRELAQVCGIDPDGLERTVARFNDGARRGVDDEFGRGSTPFNRYGGDKKSTPNPSLGPVEKGPFYAVRVVPGSFGTFAGIRTNKHAQAVDADGNPIAGLYVVGNDQASVMGGHYPAGGINLGPAMTFGFLAARHVTGNSRNE